MLQKISISNKGCSFELAIHQRILRKCITVSTKNIQLFQQQMIILEGFLMDHVTKNSA